MVTYLKQKQKCKERNVHAEGITSLKPEESFGQLVRLGFDVTVFTPASYQRPRLGRPS